MTDKSVYGGWMHKNGIIFVRINKFMEWLGFILRNAPDIFSVITVICVTVFYSINSFYEMTWTNPVDCFQITSIKCPSFWFEWPWCRNM